MARAERSVAAVSLPILVVVFLVGIYYVRIWPHVGDFVVAVDHCDQLFCDFVRYFYVMGSEVWKTRAPVPGYFYSAFFALFLSMLAWFPLNVAIWVWGILNGGLAAVLFALPFREFVRGSKISAALYTLVFATSVPLLHNFKWGQVSVIVVLCLLASFELYRRGHPIGAGIALALGASIKYYPALGAVYYLVKGERRVLVAALVAGCVFAIVTPATLLGPHDWFRFEMAALRALRKASQTNVDINSQYFSYVVLRLSLVPATDGFRLLLQMIGLAVVAANIGLIALVTRARRARETALSAVIVLLSTPFLIDTSWPHYFVFLPFCEVVLLHEALTRASGRWTVVAVPAIVLAAALSSVFTLNAVADWYTYSGRGFLFFADSLLLLAAYWLLIGPGSSRQSPATAGATTANPA